MEQFRNIYLVGSSHVASESIKEVKEKIENLKPEIIGLELDANRAYALKYKIKKPKTIFLIKSLGLMGFLFYVFGQFVQQKIGKIVNIDPGSEMLTAMKIAEKENLQIAFIDRDINITLTRFSRHFRKRELLKMLFDFVSGPFRKQKINIDLSKVPTEEVIDLVLGETKRRYPSLFKVLIDERDFFMANKLYMLTLAFPDKKIFTVCGAGHIKGIMRYLEQLSLRENKESESPI